LSWSILDRRLALKGRVLIIDDEAEIRRNLTVGLTQEEYSAVACPDGISAIHELNSARDKGVAYDYLITDIFMPDIDGLKILKVIKIQYPDLPVLVITGFGDEALKLKALSEPNTGYLDKPFEIPDLVKALDDLAPGSTHKQAVTAQPAAGAALGARESVSAYLTVRITDPTRSMDIFNQIHKMPGIQRCEAVRGDFDIIILAQGTSADEIKGIFGQIRAIPGVEIASMSGVERPKLDRDVNEFVKIYGQTIKTKSQDQRARQPGATSYVIVDIDKNAIQQIFTTVFFVDEVIFCDVIEDGKKLVGMITTEGLGRKSKIIEKLSQIDGVLRVREATVIKLMED
jgi:CheY-like chemotaxis protein/nitrate reductase NapAB chaperone NapD